uniref:SecB protein n=1 Tax=Escherichia coli TaxID=562 RepID=Q8VVM0_ECOLX|nr:ORF; putative [Escherichia coli]
MFFSTFASLLLQIVHEQRIEVNRRKVQLRECTAGYHAGDALTSIREQNVRAVCSQAMRHLGAFDTRDGENTALLNFTQERGFFAQRGRYGNTQYHFVYVICQLGRCRIQIKFNFWLPIFLENVRRVRRFERDILGINTLDLESHFSVVLF